MKTYVYEEPRDTGDTFADYLDKAKTAIISIYMHRGHLDDSPECPCPGPRARAIVKLIDEFHQRARDLNVKIVHIRTVLRPGSADDANGIPAAWRRTMPLFIGDIPNADAHAIQGSRLDQSPH